MKGNEFLDLTMSRSIFESREKDAPDTKPLRDWRLALYRLRLSITFAAHTSSMLVCWIVVPLLWPGISARAQVAPAQPPAAAVTSAGQVEPDQRYAEIERRLNAANAALQQMRTTLTQSLEQIQQMQSEIDALRAATPLKPAQSQEASATPSADGAAEDSNAKLKETVARLSEEQDAMQAEIKQHEQTKIETSSKYPLRVTGLVLFNAFSNAGVVDDIDLPSLALDRTAGTSHGSVGASVRQTVLGLEASGPDFAGAHSSADVSIDFFGGISSSYYGSSSNTVRLRYASAGLDWEKTTAQVAITSPLISPLSPTSYATVAQPGLSWAGNLWVWAPQMRVEQRIPLAQGRTLGVEAGLWDPQPTEISSNSTIRTLSPGEQARRPGYESRLSYRAGTSDRPFVLGVGGYESRQAYGGGTQLTSWAATADWQVPLGGHFDLRGEAYRGSGLGSLGGGAYKDVLSGTDRTSGLARTIGLNAVGGWSQLKFQWNRSVEINVAYGLDNAFAADFHRLAFSSTAAPLQYYARNSMVVGNLIFRPRTYLIFSPEYRRIMSWEIRGPAYTANIFSMSFGYQF
jgi:hypothetical protein